LTNPWETDITTFIQRRCQHPRRTGRDRSEYRVAIRWNGWSRSSVCAISCDDKVAAAATNRVGRDGDVSRHAEMVAMSEAQRVIENRRLSRCPLYSNASFEF